MVNVTTLQKSDRNQYGDLDIDFAKAIKTAYPKIQIAELFPHYWGGNPDMYCYEKKGVQTLYVPGGQYKSSKHYHTAGHSVLAIETARNNKLNLARRPLFLLKGYIYNSDYRSLNIGYWIFGQNEDDTFFAHRIRPKAAENGSLEECRAWMWNLKKGEKIAARQGDLAFISKTRASGSVVENSKITIGNHNIEAEIIKQTKHKIFALNPVATHYEHDIVEELKGWYELRLAKVWGSGRGD